MTATQTSNSKAFCNVLAMEKGLDAAGYAGVFETAFALEMPLPWSRALLLDTDKMPAELTQIVQIYLDTPPEDRPSFRPLFIAPDDEYSVAGYRRFISYTRQSGAIATFEQTEYLMPEADVGKLIWALSQNPDDVSQFDQYKVEHDEVRDIMVCTHGSVDVACAKFGFPLYRYLRDNLADEKLRVWRVNHFGGHVFAPTLMDMPKGDYWGFVDEDDARLIVERAGNLEPLHNKYRGWAGLPYGFAQAMERDILMQEGWQWQTYLKQGIILDTDSDEENPKWADVRIEYHSQNNSVSGAYEGRIVVDKHITTIGSTDADEDYPYPQYRVLDLVKS
ncbi:MAG: sucrase ferredoxin [Chloroflexota bacterium]